MTLRTLCSSALVSIAAIVMIARCSGNGGTAPPSPSAITTVSGDGQSGTVGLALPQPLVVRVTDKSSAPVASAQVTWAVRSGAGSLSGTSTQTDAQGEASVTWTLGPSAGTNNDTVQASASGLAGSPVTFKASGLVAATVTVYTDTGAFRQATAALGSPTVITFDDVDSLPQNNTIYGRTPFDGAHYASQGFTFASPGGYSLYIAPGGLSWNASNSLSVGHFPFDTTHVAPLNDADSLQVTLSPACRAVSLQLVDNGTQDPKEFVALYDSVGNLAKQASLPANYSSERAFIGIVSSIRIAKILIAENANDGDDVDYDDFTCFP